MTARALADKPAAVVAGTGFGRIYATALCRPRSPYRLAAILGRGSERSRRVAEHHGVPLFTSVDDIDDVVLACVVVGSGVLGGPGSDLARSFLARGADVLQEHPVHPDELADTVRLALRGSSAFAVNTLYVHTDAVRRFVQAARVLGQQQDFEYVEATCGSQVLYTMIEVLSRCLGGVRPWDLSTVVGRASDARPPFVTIEGTIASVPVVIRVQDEMDPRRPDNFMHIPHRVTIATEGGHLTLVETHGPVVWAPRSHLPDDVSATASISESEAAHFDFSAAALLGPATAPTYRAIVSRVWPEAVLTALQEMQDTAFPSERARSQQQALSVAQLALELSQLDIRLVPHREPRILSVDDLTIADALPEGRTLP